MSQKKVEKDDALYLECLLGLQLSEKQDDRVNALLDELPMCIWMHDEHYTVVYTNRAVNEKFGPCHGRKCYECFMGEKSICSCCLSMSILEGGHDSRCAQCKRNNNTYDINIFHIPLVSEDGKKHIIKSNMHIQDISILADRIFSFHNENI